MEEIGNYDKLESGDINDDSLFFGVKNVLSGEVCNTLSIETEIDKFIISANNLFENGINRSSLEQISLSSFLISSCLRGYNINNKLLNETFFELQSLSFYLNSFEYNGDTKKIIVKIGKVKKLLEQIK